MSNNIPPIQNTNNIRIADFIRITTQDSSGVEQIYRLPDDRSRLVELLLESLHEQPLSDIEAAWDAEIVRRVQAYKRGEIETCAAEEVFAEARRIAP